MNAMVGQNVIPPRIVERVSIPRRKTGSGRVARCKIGVAPASILSQASDLSSSIPHPSTNFEEHQPLYPKPGAQSHGRRTQRKKSRQYTQRVQICRKIIAPLLRGTASKTILGWKKSNPLLQDGPRTYPKVSHPWPQQLTTDGVLIQRKRMKSQATVGVAR